MISNSLTTVDASYTRENTFTGTEVLIFSWIYSVKVKAFAWF